MLADWRHFRQMAAGSGLGLFVLMALLFWPTILVIRDQLSPGVLIGVVALLGIVYWIMLRVLVYRYAYWATLLPFLGQFPRILRLTFAEDHFSMDFGQVSSQHKWQEIEEIQVFAPLWLFRLHIGGHFAVPASLLSPGLEELIRRKASEAGFDVRQ
jgi:hypothetical protein